MGWNGRKYIDHIKKCHGGCEEGFGVRAFWCTLCMRLLFRGRSYNHLCLLLWLQICEHESISLTTEKTSAISIWRETERKIQRRRKQRTQNNQLEQLKIIYLDIFILLSLKFRESFFLFIGVSHLLFDTKDEKWEYHNTESFWILDCRKGFESSVFYGFSD